MNKSASILEQASRSLIRRFEIKRFSDKMRPFVQFQRVPFGKSKFKFKNCTKKDVIDLAYKRKSVKITLQFETEGNGQNDIVSQMNRSEVKALK